MIQGTYQQLIEKISKLGNIPIEDVTRRIEAKKSKLSGLISNEGAAQVVAAELGVSFENQKLKVIDLMIGMKKVQVIGKIIDVYPIKKYNKNGREGEIGSLRIGDDTSSIRVVLWDVKLIDMLRNNLIKPGDMIEIKNADVRGTSLRELHLGSYSEISPSDVQMENIISTLEKPKTMKIKDIKTNDLATISGTIVQVFQPAFFSVCPECNMKVTFENEKAVCVRHGPIMPQKRAILNLVIDDGSDSVRATLFSNNMSSLLKVEEGSEKLQDTNFFLDKKSEILGTEWTISGRMKKNILFDRNEFTINSLQEADPEIIIQELSKEVEI
jgi:hypothetical protein